MTLSATTPSPSSVAPLPPRPGSKAPWNERAAFWRACLDLHAASGLNITDFCRQYQIGKFSLYSWRRTFDAQSGATHREAAAQEFVEVLPAAPAAPTSGMTAEGSSIVPAAAGVAWLAELARLSAALHAHLAGAV